MHFIGHSAKLLPSDNLTLGKEKLSWRWLCRVSRSSTRQRSPLCRPSLTQTLGKGGHCAECHRQDTRQTGNLCRVSGPLHSANMWYLPSAMTCALGKACSQACSQVITLPSVMAIALGKVTENSLFICFYIPSKQTEDIYNKHHQHHIYITNITYISPTPHIYHKRHMSHNISQISSQVIQVLYHLQPQLQIEVPLTTISIIT